MGGRIVKRFADSETVYKDSYPVQGQKYTHWVEYTDGTKESVGEVIISGLWNHWMYAENVFKYSKDGFTVFEYKER